MAEREGLDAEQLKNLSDTRLYRIEVAANRYDLLCLEGIALALRIFLKLEKPPKFLPIKSEPSHQFFVEESVKEIRHFAIGAVLRGLSFTEDTLKSFIELQDKLHQNICRQRTLVTMGTHDFDTVKGPFYFRALHPSEIKFKALKQTEVTDGFQLLEKLRTDNKLKKYCHLLDGKEKYPVLFDSQGITMALPPLINSEHSKITTNTKNVFIDVTAHDETKAKIVLNTLVTMFSVYCEKQYTVEQVEVIDYNGNKAFYPDLSFGEFKTKIPYLTEIAGTGKLEATQVAEYLQRMGLETTVQSADELLVSVPPTRSDILHPCDIAEDLAISFGYNNIQKIIPNTVCNGYQQPINKMTDLIRQELAMTGYTECLTFSLISKKDAIANMGNEIDDKSLADFVQILKAKTSEFQVVRTSLIPGMLKNIEKNHVNPLPLRLFEISDVVVIDKNTETGARNERRLSFAYVNNNSGFEILQGAIDHLLENKLGLPWNKPEGYTIRESNDKRFFKGRQAEIVIEDRVFGIFGIVNPEVLSKFGIPYPVTIVELEIEAIFEMIIKGRILGSKEKK